MKEIITRQEELECQNAQMRATINTLLTLLEDGAGLMMDSNIAHQNWREHVDALSVVYRRQYPLFSLKNGKF